MRWQALTGRQEFPQQLLHSRFTFLGEVLNAATPFMNEDDQTLSARLKDAVERLKILVDFHCWRSDQKCKVAVEAG